MRQAAKRTYGACYMAHIADMPSVELIDEAVEAALPADLRARLRATKATFGAE